jgi:DNA repair protein RadC
MTQRVPIYSVRLIRDRYASIPPTIRDAGAAAEFFQRLIGQADREHVAALFLDHDQRPVGSTIAGIGSINSVPVHAREVFKAAILAGAFSIILAHNHPLGSSEPSPGDLHMTRKLVLVSKHLGIPITDHIIVSPSGSYVSMSEAGFLAEAA